MPWSSMPCLACTGFFCFTTVYNVSVVFFSHRAQSHSHSFPDAFQLSEYAQEKLKKLGCNRDPYADSYTNEVSMLPTVKYSHIYDFIANHMVDGNDPQRAFKSLDNYRMVVSSGWMGSLYVKKWPHATIVKCEVKPSQRSGVIYKSWVAFKPCGSVQCGHCTCMAGLSEVCNHVGAVLYKAMHEVSVLSEVSCTSLPNR